MWVYRLSDRGQYDDPWDVGYFDPTGEFIVAHKCYDEESAASSVNYLNGGSG